MKLEFYALSQLKFNILSGMEFFTKKLPVLQVAKNNKQLSMENSVHTPMSMHICIQTKHNSLIFVRYCKTLHLPSPYPHKLVKQHIYDLSH